MSKVTFGDCSESSISLPTNGPHVAERKEIWRLQRVESCLLMLMMLAQSISPQAHSDLGIKLQLKGKVQKGNLR